MYEKFKIIFKKIWHVIGSLAIALLTFIGIRKCARHDNGTAMERVDDTVRRTEQGLDNVAKSSQQLNENAERTNYTTKQLEDVTERGNDVTKRITDTSRTVADRHERITEIINELRKRDRESAKDN